MPEHIVENALMQCTQGAAPVPLTVTSQQFATIENKLKATELDIAPMVNIPSFGACAALQGPCVPAPTSWQKTSLFTVNDLKELTTDSFCICGAGGGKIQFTCSGQAGFSKTE